MQSYLLILHRKPGEVKPGSEESPGWLCKKWHNWGRMRHFDCRLDNSGVMSQKALKYNKNFLTDTWWKSPSPGLIVLPLLMKGRKNWEGAHQGWTIQEPVRVNFPRTFCTNLSLQQKNKTGSSSGKRPEESSLFREHQWRLKLVEISAEEKNSVEMWEVPAYHRRRKESRGRKQEGRIRWVEGSFVEWDIWDKQGPRSWVCMWCGTVCYG